MSEIGSVTGGMREAIIERRLATTELRSVAGEQKSATGELRSATSELSLTWHAHVVPTREIGSVVTA